MKKLGLFLFLLAMMAVAVSSQPVVTPPVFVPGAKLFTPLHHYYISTTGNDSNNGLTPATAWATMFHNTVCGDLMEVIPGTYTNQLDRSNGTILNCPSTTGGIDGTGGIWFLAVVCGGSDLEACVLANTTAGGLNGGIGGNNIAMIGFKCAPPGAATRCFETWACDTVLHHTAFINDVAINTLQGFDTNDCGGTLATVPGVSGADYFAVVGSIAQNAAQDNICLAAIDVVGPGVFDAAAGTHYFINGNVSYSHALPGTCSDVEAFMFDTWDFHNVNTQGILSNNIGFNAARMCIQMFWQNNANDTPNIKILNNTCFRNNVNTAADNMDGEININNHGGTPNLPWPLTIQKNIAYQPLATSPTGGGSVAAYAAYGTITTLTNGGTGNENVLFANNTSCKFTNCDSTFSAETQGAAGQLGTNTYTNPSFANTADLLANRLGAPNCTGKQTVTQCMGYDPNTQTLTSLSIIGDLQASCAGCAGKGYQLPSTICAANADYPVWLKGMVGLRKNQVDGKFYEYPDLVTKPCGL